jgi:hypothetical protein
LSLTILTHTIAAALADQEPEKYEGERRQKVTEGKTKGNDERIKVQINELQRCERTKARKQDYDVGVT